MRRSGFSEDLSVSGGNEVADDDLSSGLVDDLAIDMSMLTYHLITAPGRAVKYCG